MLTNYQKTMLRHGLIVMLLGLLGGFGLAFNVLGEIGLSPIPWTIDYQIPGSSARWQAVHTGNIMNGLLAILFAWLIGHLALSERAKKFVCYGTVMTVWGNAFFYMFAVFAPNRGLSLGESKIGAANWASFFAYVPAIIAAVLLIGIVLILLAGLAKSE